METPLTISYDLLTNDMVSIILINMKGQTVYRLLNKRIGPGRHYIELDATKARLSPGNYILEFKTKKRLLTQLTIKL